VVTGGSAPSGSASTILGSGGQMLDDATTGGATTGGATTGGATTGGTALGNSGGAGAASDGGGNPSYVPGGGSAGLGPSRGSAGVPADSIGPGHGGAAPDLDRVLVITEIMFNPQSTPELEWVELCNRALTPLDLDGYTFWDDDNDSSVTPNFPPDTVVPAASCVVLTGVDVVPAFQEAWGMDVTVVGLTEFPTLTNSGDRIQLWDAEHPPLPEDVDPGTDAVIAFDYAGSLGDGAASIQLVDLAADPADPKSWERSGDGFAVTITDDGDIGTPGIGP